MKVITIYEAADGTRWDTEAQARAQDELVEKAARFLVSIGAKERPKDLDYQNGHGYVQHPSGTRESLIGWLKRHGWNRDARGTMGALEYRARCMDEKDREWGQPYFALNPEKGEAVEILADVSADAGPSSEEPGEAEAP